MTEDEEKKHMRQKKIYMAVLALLIGVPLLALAQGYSGLIAPQPGYKGSSNSGGYAGVIANPPGTAAKLTDSPAAKDLYSFVENSGKQSPDDMRATAMKNIAARRQARIDEQNTAAADKQKKQIEEIKARQLAEKQRREEEAAARAQQGY